MPLFRKTANANSANRRRRRGQLLLNNNTLTRNLESAFSSKNRVWRKYWTNSVVNRIRTNSKWTPNLVPRLNMTLINKLRNAYNSIKPELKKRSNNAIVKKKAAAANAAAARQMRQANERRKANQHAAYLLTNEGKQWKSKNNEARRIKKEQNNEQARRRNQINRNMYASSGYTMNNFGGHGSSW
jgi:hypothetical protein